MTVRLRALWGLRIDGPCSISDLADRIGHERRAVYSAVYGLRREGLADHLGPASYDVTPAGRVYLDALPAAEGTPSATLHRLAQLRLFD